MKKFCSLFRASMTEGMSIFKINGRKDKKLLLAIMPIVLMLSVGVSAYHYFEVLSVTHMQYVLLAIMALGVSVFTLIEGVYKSGTLLFNCNDNQLLFSLPIRRSNILFLRIIKFYIFELLFNSLFILPFMISYVFWAENLTWSYYLVSLIMILILPIIPVVVSCIIGFFITNLSVKFKKKNIVQIILSFILLCGFLYFSSNSQNYLNYLLKNIKSINEFVTKLYYPAGTYIQLITSFSWNTLIIFITVNLIIFMITVWLLNMFYFRINSQNQNIFTNRRKSISNFKTKPKSIYCSLVKKELITFFNIPVLIINSGFSLVLFVLIVFLATTRFDAFLNIIVGSPELNISRDLIINNMSVFIFIVLSFTSFMTSITSSLISLEGKNINFIRTLPISPKKVLISKVLACLLITTPILFFGNLFLIIRFKIKIIEGLLLLLLSILVPLVPHFLGLIINLEFPKFDAITNAEVVKQSVSSLLSVALGIVIFIIFLALILKLLGTYSSLLILLVSSLIYIIMDALLYFFVIKWGTKRFHGLSY